MQLSRGRYTKLAECHDTTISGTRPNTTMTTMGAYFCYQTTITISPTLHGKVFKISTLWPASLIFGAVDIETCLGTINRFLADCVSSDRSPTVPLLVPARDEPNRQVVDKVYPRNDLPINDRFSEGWNVFKICYDIDADERNTRYIDDIEQVKSTGIPRERSSNHSIKLLQISPTGKWFIKAPRWIVFDCCIAIYTCLWSW